MYVYGFNAILATAMKNRRDKEMIWAFIQITTDLKIHGIDPGFHFMDKKSSTALKMAMTSMGIKYQLVPPSYHRGNNAEREIHTFKKYFIWDYKA